MSKSETPKTKRILLKLSGEALMGDNAFGISRDTLKSIVGEIKEVVDLGVQLAIVSAAATSSAESHSALPVWIAPPATIWACWPPA